MELREHHCLGEEEYLPPAEGPAEFIDNPLNAWIPRDVTFEERDVSVLCSLINSFLSTKHFPAFLRELVIYGIER